MVVASLTEPQLLQVLEPPAIAAEHLGQVLCIFACDLLQRRFEIQGADLCFDDGAFVLLLVEFSVCLACLA